MADSDNKSQLYTIKELERLTGLPRRTIHFYIKERLIPPPDGLGRSARYGEEHRLRLNLIRLLKENTYLRLEGIREMIEPMTTDELQREIEWIEAGNTPRSLMGPPAGPPPPPYEARMEGPGAPDPEMRLTEDQVKSMDAVTRLNIGGPYSIRMRRARMKRDEDTGPELLMGRAADPSRPSGVEDSDTWERYRLSDDVEIHFRASDDEGFVKKLRKLIKFARKLFR